jgi:hypothetical protein
MDLPLESKLHKLSYHLDKMHTILPPHFFPYILHSSNGAGTPDHSFTKDILANALLEVTQPTTLRFPLLYYNDWH